MSQNSQQPGVQIELQGRARTGLLWGSIGLAVLTSLFQGLATTVVSIAEDQSMWTFRFRVARFEHWWWTMVSSLLSASFGLIVLSFLSGNNSDSLGVLALSTATGIAIVQYAIPAWRNRSFAANRWFAWTGSSRTAIPSTYAKICGNAGKWEELEHQSKSRIAAPPSDDWGPALRAPRGISQDPTAILNNLKNVSQIKPYSEHWELGPCIYDDGLHGQVARDNVSLLWGEQQGFRRRVSRAINSMPVNLLKSRPHTTNGYNGEGLCLALGVLGRNKGLAPMDLVFDFDDRVKLARGLKRQGAAGSTTAVLEGTSTWSPRPNKVMRSYYYRAMEEQFGTLPSSFVGAATELALIFLDCTPGAIQAWFSHELEQQSLAVNHAMSRPHVMRNIRGKPPRATSAEMKILYRAQYTSMVLSINYFPRGFGAGITATAASANKAKAQSKPERPDLPCFALLYLAEGATKPSATGEHIPGAGAPMPRWWTYPWVKERLDVEAAGLSGEWHASAAWLLGLTHWPIELVKDWPSWPAIIYRPSYINASRQTENRAADQTLRSMVKTEKPSEVDSTQRESELLKANKEKLSAVRRQNTL